MNLTQEQEAALYVQYTPLIYKTVHHFCRLRGIRPEYFEDLFQEASVAFIRHLRRITSTEDIVRFRTELLEFLHASKPEVFDELAKAGKWTGDVENLTNAAIEAFKLQFAPTA